MAKPLMPLAMSEGQASRQAHVSLPEGSYERESGREGFFGPATHIYHAHPPTGWVNFEGPLRPRAFDFRRLDAAQPSPWDAQLFVHNAHVKVRFWRTSGRMDHLVRNADGDELMFVHEGRGDLFCDYGHITVEQGDYIVIPRGTMWRTVFDGPATALLVEATNSAYELPDRGLLGHHAIFDPAVLSAPKIDDAFEAQKQEAQSGDGWKVVVKRLGDTSTITYPFNPLDAVGWKGNLTPARLSMRDIRPVLSARYHLPPSAHTTFVSDRFVICTFAPRPFETAPEALKVPFFHSNEDYDEVIFYHAGDFFSRDHIEAGMATFHPAGFPHGPHPKALARAFKQTKAATDEYAVNIDTRDPLHVADLPVGVEIEDYVNSWKESGASG